MFGLIQPISQSEPNFCSWNVAEHVQAACTSPCITSACLAQSHSILKAVLICALASLPCHVLPLLCDTANATSQVAEPCFRPVQTTPLLVNQHLNCILAWVLGLDFAFVIHLMQACLNSQSDEPPSNKTLRSLLPAASQRSPAFESLCRGASRSVLGCCQEEIYRAIREAYDVKGSFADEEDDGRDNVDSGQSR